MWLIVGVAATAGLVAAEYARSMPAKSVTKTTAAVAFVGQAVHAGALEVGAVGIALLVALGLSLVGDVCLLSRDRRAFLAGLVAFLLGHVAFVATFALLEPGPSWPVSAGTFVLTGAVGAAVFAKLRSHAGRLAGPVAGYVAVITVMVATAAGVSVTAPDRWPILVAALSFWASDLCVARDRFLAPGFVNRAIGLPLYFGAQLAFATLLPAVAS